MSEVPQTLDDTAELAKQDKARCPWCKQVFRIEDLTDEMLCRPCYGDD